MSHLPRTILGLAVLSALVILSPVNAQPYPTGLVRLVVPSAAGTPPDIVGRLVMNEIARAEGWRTVVENKPGPMQTIGLAEVLRQPADGHTLIALSQSGTVGPALLPNVSYRLETDVAPVVKMVTTNHVLVVHPSVAAKSLPELVALLKRQPDRFTFSSGGFGTPAHLGGELFKLQTGVRAQHVPYPALPRAIADLINGTNQYQFITPLPVQDLIATGKLRALAVTGPRRLDVLPDVPTVAEQGYPDLIVQDWIGLVVKSGTPAEVVARLNAAANKALASPAVRGAIQKAGGDIAGGSAAEFGAFVRAQLAYWAKLVKDAGMRM